MTKPAAAQKVPWGLYGFVAVVSAALAFFDLNAGPSDEALQLLTRHTARFSFALFLVVFLARPLATWTGADWVKELVRRRRHLGLAFALAHFIHLAAIVSFFVWIEAVPAAITLVFGGFGYVLLAAMTVTSTDRAMRALGRNWKRLHTTGIYYLWLIFAQSYAGRVFASGEGQSAEASPREVYALLLGLAVAALAFRLACRRRASQSLSR